MAGSCPKPSRGPHHAHQPKDVAFNRWEKMPKQISKEKDWLSSLTSKKSRSRVISLPNDLSPHSDRPPASASRLKHHQVERAHWLQKAWISGRTGSSSCRRHGSWKDIPASWYFLLGCARESLPKKLSSAAIGPLQAQVFSRTGVRPRSSSFYAGPRPLCKGLRTSAREYPQEVTGGASLYRCRKTSDELIGCSRPMETLRDLRSGFRRSTVFSAAISTKLKR